MSCEVVGYVMAWWFSKGEWVTLELQNCIKNHQDINRAVVKEYKGKVVDFYPVKANGEVYYVVKEKADN